MISYWIFEQHAARLDRLLVFRFLARMLRFSKFFGHSPRKHRLTVYSGFQVSVFVLQVDDSHTRFMLICDVQVARPNICAKSVGGSLYDFSVCCKCIVVYRLFFRIYLSLACGSLRNLNHFAFLSSPFQNEKVLISNASDALDRIRCESITDLKERGFFMSGTNSTRTSPYGCRNLRT